MLVQRARDNLCAVAFCNAVGGQDELVFDGHSVVIDHDGEVIARAPQFAEALVFATVDVQGASTARLRDARLRPPVRSQLPAVDSCPSLERGEAPVVAPAGGEVAVLLIAADALGPDRVTAVVMPSRYSSEGTQSDARVLAANLGVRCLDIAIEP